MANIIYQGTNGQILVDNLVLTDKQGTGECQVSSSGIWLSKGYRVEYEAMIVDKFLFDNESGKTITNDGATATVSLTLPNNVGAGINYSFIRVASQTLRIIPASASFIYSGGTMAVGEYLDLASNGARLSVVSNANSDWVVTLEFGTLTEETP